MNRLEQCLRKFSLPRIYAIAKSKIHTHFPQLRKLSGHRLSLSKMGPGRVLIKKGRTFGVTVTFNDLVSGATWGEVQRAIPVKT